MRSHPGRVGRPRLVRQLHPTECGLCCCAVLLRAHGSPVRVRDLRLRYVVGRDGLNLADLTRILRQEGATPHAYEATADEVLRLDRPAICYWNDNHYVVVDPARARGDRVEIVDPGNGRSWISRADLAQRFSGYAVTVDRPDAHRGRGLPGPARVLAGLARPHLALLAATLVAALATSLAMLWLPRLMTLVFGSTGQTGVDGALWPVLILVGAAVGNALLLLVRTLVSLVAATAVGKAVSEAVFARMLRLPYGELVHRGVGDLLFTLESVQRLRTMLTTDLVTMVVGCVLVATMLGWLLTVSALAGLAAVVVVVLLALLAVLAGRGVRAYSLEETRHRAELQAVQVAALSSVESVKTNAMEDAYVRTWRRRNDLVQRHAVRLQVVQGVFTSLGASLQLVGPVLVVLAVAVGTPTAADAALVVSLQALAGLLFGQVTLVAGSFTQVAQGWALLERVADVLVRPQDATFDGDAAAPSDGTVELDGVAFSYASFAPAVLPGLSLRIPAGAKAAIVGASGSGKSTVGRLIVGLSQPTAGTVRVGGRALREYDREGFYSAVAYVPQNVVLAAGTVRENLAAGAGEVSDDDILRAADAVGLRAELEALPLGLDTPVAQLGQNFSGGQRQRIVLARAALKRARVVVLDEATSSLDAQAEARVTSFFDRGAATRVVIAHRLSTVIDADVIFVMDHGRIVEQGSHHELLGRGGAYAALYREALRSDETRVPVT